ncbi:WXG100 family type VII secretion target [Kitasatospora acidiphila]|uniref:WXG100 family type VII secretion target n=1 Tax=Kitasatospora acidiphila TaxID=2567942 RepID=UPI003C71012A
MTEQRNWTDLGFNPAPGDQGVVSELSSSLRQVAGHLISVHAVLTRIVKGQDEWTGDAAKAFGDHLGKLPGYLQDAPLANRPAVKPHHSPEHLLPMGTATP